MAVVGTFRISFELTGLGKDVSIPESFDVTDAVVEIVHGFVDPGDTSDHDLDLGEIASDKVTWLVVYAKTGKTTFAFNSATGAAGDRHPVNEGELVPFPVTMDASKYISYTCAADTADFEYWLLGKA